MILDTNALSAWADGNVDIEPVLRSANRLVVPSIVLGEFDFGTRQSRFRRRYTEWLEESLHFAEVATIDQITATYYGEIRLALKKAGEPIPVNDTWIAAVAAQFKLPILSKDAHFDLVEGLRRLTW
jgi:predicted nucleic acid-binding protein